MREILFRGKIFDTEEWIYGGLIGGASEGNPVIIEEDFDVDETYFGVGTWASVLRKTVGQYTGLKDKNGTKIFEGDIIELVNADNETIHVICKFGTVRRPIFENTVDITGFYFELPNGRKTFPITNNYLGKHDLELFEVIGNIHDNPKLLESSPC